MTVSNRVMAQIQEFLKECLLDDCVSNISSLSITPHEMSNIDLTLNKIRTKEAHLRRVRQEIEYKVRQHRLDEFRMRK